MFSKHVGFNDANVNGKKLTADATNLTRDGNKILDDGDATAADVAVVATGFDGILSGTDTDVQTAMATIDQHSHTAAQTSVVNSSFSGILASDTDVQASLASIDTAIPAVIDNYYDTSLPVTGLVQKQALTGLMSQGMAYSETIEVDLSGQASATIPVSDFSAEDLEIVIQGRSAESDTQDYVALRFNSDTGANYDSNARFFGADDSSGGLANDGAGLTYAVVGALPAATAASDYPGYVKILVNGFSGTTYYKSYVGKCQAYEDSASSDAGIVSYDLGGFWRSTDAITSVTIYLISTSNFASGTLTCRGAGAMAGGSFDRETLRVDAYLSSAQAIASETETTVIFDSETTDLDSAYNNATGVWTCPKAARYDISAQFSLDTVSGYGYLYKNGSTLVLEGGSVIAVGGVFVILKKTLDLTYGETVEVKAWRSGGSQVEAGVSKTFLQITEAVAGSAIGDTKLLQDTTVNFDSSMSASDMQAVINSQPKSLNGFNLTFQFADGTYSLDVGLLFDGFVGGQLVVYGHQNESVVAYSTQSVILNSDGLTAGVLYFNRCSSVYMKWIKIVTENASDDNHGVYTYACSSAVYEYCCVLGAGATYAANGFLYQYCQARCNMCLASNLRYGFSAGRGTLDLTDCESYGTLPVYGARGYSGATVAISGTDIVGINSRYISSSGGSCGWIRLYSSKTVVIPSGSSCAEIQAIIDSQPQDFGGYTLTIQFEAGTYTIDSQLNFQYFYGGKITIQGDPTDSNWNSARTNQTVHLNGSTLGTSASVFNVSCGMQVYVGNIKFTIPDGANAAVYAWGVPRCEVYYCYVLGSGKTSAAIGFRTFCTNGTMAYNYVSNMQRGFQGQASLVFSNNNYSTGTNPTYGLYAIQATKIGKNGTQPTGTTANEYVTQGGEIS